MTDYKWKISNGAEIYVRHMITSDIENAVELIEQKSFNGFDEHISMKNSNLGNIDWEPVYERMLLELRLRKLEGKNYD